MPGSVTVAVDDAAGVRSITLRRPPVNALSLAEYDALTDAFDVGDASRVVLLRAEGHREREHGENEERTLHCTGSFTGAYAFE